MFNHNGMPQKLPHSKLATTLALMLSATLMAGCATLGTQTNNAPTCAAIKHSPKYSGKALDKAGQKPLHRWVAVTNGTLDKLKCVD